MRGGQWEDIVDAADRPERDSDHRPRGGERVARAERRRHGSQARVEESAQARTRTGAPALCVFITAVPNTKMCAWVEEDSGGHVL